MKAKLRHLPVLAVYLIGSQARGQARDDSDVNIAHLSDALMINID